MNDKIPSTFTYVIHTTTLKTIIELSFAIYDKQTMSFIAVEHRYTDNSTKTPLSLKTINLGSLELYSILAYYHLTLIFCYLIKL